MIVPAISQKETAVSDGSTLMIYLRSILGGVLAVLAAAVGMIGIFALLARLLGGDVRPGFSLSWKTGVTAALIFALGFAWQFRRTGKIPQNSEANKKTTGSASARRG